MDCVRLLKILFILLTLLFPACRQQMAEQPSYQSFQPASFFEDNRSARPLVEGTVPRGHLHADSHFYRGKKSYTNKWTYAAGVVTSLGFNPFASVTWARTTDPVVETFPFRKVAKKLDLQDGSKKEQIHLVLQRGRERYDIFCSACHGLAGKGDGMVVQRGYSTPPSYHIPRLRVAPLGHFYRVITNGYGAMPAHDTLIPPEDRWAIVAYVRALQRSQNSTLEDVRLILNLVPRREQEKEQLPETLRQAMEKGAKNRE